MGSLFGGGGGGDSQIQTVQPPLKTDNAVQGPLGSLAVRQLGSQGAFAPFGRGSAFVPGVAFGQVQMPGPNPTRFGNPGNAMAATPFFGSAGFAQQQPYAGMPQQQATPFTPQQQQTGGSSQGQGGGQGQSGGQAAQERPGVYAGAQPQQQQAPQHQQQQGYNPQQDPYFGIYPSYYQNHLANGGAPNNGMQMQGLFPGINLYNPFLTNYTPQSNNGMYGTAGFQQGTGPQPQQQQPPATGSGGTQGATQ